MIKIALSLFIAALALFLAAEAFSALPLLAYLTQAFYPLGALSLLASFALLFAALLLLAGKHILCAIRRYFSGIERRQRRLWFVQGKLDRERGLFFHRRLQTRYFLEAKMRRLTQANNRTHSRSLAKAIDSDLAAIKAQVSADLFKTWRRQNRAYRRQANIEGLIALQQTILTHREHA
ncbi:hypothetical protein [Methylomicrobium lacus]|uniref:hypothetical protein n=1 Tax=Methylomicrobium lacus TaxID=136992 RepID=UPI0035A83601